MDGLVPSQLGQKKKDLLKPKQCPNCDEANKPESKFCSKCRFVLSYDAFNETLEEKSKAASETEEIKKKIEEIKGYLDQKMREDIEKDMSLKNLLVDMAKLEVAVEAPRKRIEELDNKINKYELRIAAILEERRREEE
jgi:hypothetical protein